MFKKASLFVFVIVICLGFSLPASGTSSHNKSLYINRLMGLYNKKGDKYFVSLIYPQTVKIILRDGDWFLINTRLGAKWIDLTFKPPGSELEWQIKKSYDVRNSLLTDKSFIDLLLLDREPEAYHYLEFNDIQKKLSIMTRTQDMIDYIYILFKENPVFISS
jgi:hypothetical protein